VQKHSRYAIIQPALRRASLGVSLACDTFIAPVNEGYTWRRSRRMGSSVSEGESRFKRWPGLASFVPLGLPVRRVWV